MGTLGMWPGPPDIFFFLSSPQLAVVKEFFLNYLITFAKINCKGNPGKYFIARGSVRLGGGAQGPTAGKDATDVQPYPNSGSQFTAHELN